MLQAFMVHACRLMASWFMQAAAAPRDHDDAIMMTRIFYYHAHKLAIISRSRFLKIRVESRFSFRMVDMYRGYARAARTRRGFSKNLANTAGARTPM
jgi:hypothetical protein